MTTETKQAPTPSDIINSAKQRTEYCSDPTNGQPNTAVYALVDTFRQAAIVPPGQSDNSYIRWNPEDKLVALDMASVTPARIPDALKAIQLVAERFALQPMAMSRRDNFRPVALDAARISLILTYPHQFYPDLVTFQSKDTPEEK